MPWSPVKSLSRHARRIAALVLAVAPSLSFAADHYLILGGGPDRANNQVSLETNVNWVLRILDGWNVPRDRRHVLFSDGTSPQPDLVQSRATPRKELTRSLALAFNQLDAFDLEYRSATPSQVDGPATKDAIRAWFDGPAQRLVAGDRLVVYFTGHGRAIEKNTVSVLDLWPSKELSVSDWTALLDRLPAGVDALHIMVQCHSGGFAHLVREGGVGDRPMSSRGRCGLFATWIDREAAGCTPDVNALEYKEYSTYFWAAVSGTDRAGVGVRQPDLNGDGAISPAEAHAYVQVHAETIDIPLSTSRAFLKSRSTTLEDPPVTPESPWAALLAAAAPETAFVLTGLSRELKLDESPVAARQKVEGLHRMRRQALRRLNRSTREIAPLRETVRKHLVETHPELEHPLSPKYMELLTTRADDVKATLAASSDFSRLDTLDQIRTEMEDRVFQLDKQEARLLRFLDTVDEVVQANYLQVRGSDADKADYARLLELERRPLAPVRK